VGFYDGFMAWTNDSDESAESSARWALHSAWRTPGEPQSNPTPFDALTAEFVADPDGVDKAFQHVDAVADQDPYLALAQVTTLTALFNNAATTTARLTRRLSDYIKKLKGTLDKIKRAVSAASYTVTVGFPFAVSIGVTFQ
jgi:hypothetical protein